MRTRSTPASGRLPGFLETPAVVLAARDLAASDSFHPVMTEGALLGPYRIAGLLARGGMGDVYRAVDTRLRREVALKVMAGTKTADPQRIERFMQEARVTAAFNHPNIVRALRRRPRRGPRLPGRRAARR